MFLSVDMDCTDILNTKRKCEGPWRRNSRDGATQSEGYVKGWSGTLDEIKEQMEVGLYAWRGRTRETNEEYGRGIDKGFEYVKTYRGCAAGAGKICE